MYSIFRKLEAVLYAIVKMANMIQHFAIAFNEKQRQLANSKCENDVSPCCGVLFRRLTLAATDGNILVIYR